MSSAASGMAYRIRLQSRREVADRTQGLQFDRPASFSFKTGVFVEMTLVDATETDALGNTTAAPDVCYQACFLWVNESQFSRGKLLPDDAR